jgi:hypothetical protein
MFLDAQASEKKSIENNHRTLNSHELLELQFPADAAILHELWLPKNNSQNLRVILHIQDAHCHFEAQMNIAKLIEKLMPKYDINLVAVEGTSGPIDTSSLTKFTDEEVKEKVVKYFIKKGKITGPEYVSIVKKIPFSLVGIEDATVYDNNLTAFKKLLPFRQESQILCDAIQQSFFDLKPIIFSKKLYQTDQHIQNYRSGKLSIREFAKILEQEFQIIHNGKKHEFLKEKTPHFLIFLESMNLEKNLNSQAQQTENLLLQKKLNASLTKEKLSELIAASLQVRLGRMNQTQYYLILGNALKKASGKNVPESLWGEAFPETVKYIEYAETYEAIDHKKLFTEIDILTEYILENLFENNDQRKLYHLSQNITLLKKLFLLEMNRKDFNDYTQNKNAFQSQKFKSFIEEKAKNHPISNIEEIRKLPIKNLDQYQPDAELFYSTANQRDQILVHNTLKAMKESRNSVAIMITGGYHTEGVKEIFKEKNIAYALLSPRITQDDPNNPYVQILSEQKSTFEEFLSHIDEQD